MEQSTCENLDQADSVGEGEMMKESEVVEEVRRNSLAKVTKNVFVFVNLYLCASAEKQSCQGDPDKEECSSFDKENKRKDSKAAGLGKVFQDQLKGASFFFYRNEIKEMLTSFVVLLLSHFHLVKVVIPAARLRRRKSSCCLPYDEEIQDAMNKFYQM